MILNPEWLKPKEKPYFHQISLNCIEKLVKGIESFDKGEIDADTSSKIVTCPRSLHHLYSIRNYTAPVNQ